MQRIYSILMILFSWGIKLHSLFSAKSKKMVLGYRITNKFIQNKPKEEYVWFHAASLGEFEQGRPIIEALKAKDPSQKILVTFFSPSGFEVRKDYKYADKVLYLPIDTQKNAVDFVSGLNIKLAVFIKYEFWFNYLKQLQLKGIPIFYISTVFRPDQIYFRLDWMLKILKGVKHFYVQNEKSKKFAESQGLKNITVAGDTRLDSVLLNVKEDFECDQITAGLDGRKLIVFGSSWSGDHDLIIPFIEKYGSKYQYLIAPHEIKEAKIKEIISKISINVSRLSKSEILKDVMIIDSIGKLKYLYRYASVVYIGGGYNKNIHNTLEPLVYGVPVLFGPNGYQKFQEAVSIKEQHMGRLTSVKTFNADLEFYLSSAENRLEVSKRIKSYIFENKGATEKIILGLSS